MGKDTSIGKIVEQHLQQLITNWGLTVVPFADWDPAVHGWEALLTDVPYASIYDREGRVVEAKCKSEFLLVSADHGLVVRIESKYQAGSGSTDEKIPFALENLEALVQDANYPESMGILVMGGDGFRTSAFNYANARSERFTNSMPEGVRVDVKTIGSFLAWIVHHLAPLTDLPKQGLESRAATWEIRGRTTMGKKDLIRAIEEAQEKAFSREKVLAFVEGMRQED